MNPFKSEGRRKGRLPSSNEREVNKKITSYSPNVVQKLQVVLKRIDMDKKKSACHGMKGKKRSLVPHEDHDFSYLPGKKGKFFNNSNDGSITEHLQQSSSSFNNIHQATEQSSISSFENRFERDDLIRKDVGEKNSTIRDRSSPDSKNSYKVPDDWEEEVSSGSEYVTESESSSGSSTDSECTSDLSEGSQKKKTKTRVSLKSSYVETNLPAKNTLSSSPVSKSNNSYIANSSADSGLDVSTNLESVGKAIKNRRTAILLHSKCGPKRYACIFCLKKREKFPDTQVLYTKLSKHFVAKHSKEKEVIELIHNDLSTCKKSEKKTVELKRHAIIKCLRDKGNYLNNIRANTGEEFVVARRPRKAGTSISSMAPCPQCKVAFSRSSLRKHVVTCTGKSFKRKHEIQSLANRVEGNYHVKATEDAISIASHIRDNNVHDEIRHDYSIILWLNAEARKRETTKHHYEKIRANLCRLGRLKREMKKMIRMDNLSDIFNEECFDDFIKAVKILGKTDKQTKFMAAPATASDVGALVKDVAQVYFVDLGTDKKNEAERTLISNFLFKFKVMWHRDIGNTISESQARQKRNKKEVIPDKDDTIRLRKSLEIKMADAYKALLTEYSDEKYINLRNALAVHIQLTNCRRVGEVERLEMDTLSNFEENNGKFRIEVRGKRTRPVPIIFDKKVRTYLDLLVKKRKEAKISTENCYVFANIHDLNNDFTYIRISRIIPHFAENCDANVPESLRGTKFRKQVATYGAKEGINERAVGNLSEFLGHTDKIHRKNYRTLDFERDMETIEQIQKAQGFCDQNYESQINYDFDNPVNENQSPPYENEDIEKIQSVDDQHFDSEILEKEISHNYQHAITETNLLQENRKSVKNDAQPIHGRKTQWLREDIRELLKAFPNALDLNHKVPSSQEIILFQRRTTNLNLKARKEPQIRSWIHTQRRKENKEENSISERNTIPTYIYSNFSKYIENGKEPSLKTYSKFLISSPSLANITLSNVQNWVKMAIKKKSC